MAAGNCNPADYYSYAEASTTRHWRPARSHGDSCYADCHAHSNIYVHADRATDTNTSADANVDRYANTAAPQNFEF